jgi:tRNA modification GTPase
LVVAIAGPPNAGKSTLLNRIARREAAIVSPVPGTTRDVIEVHLDLDGYPVTLLDTAGIRDSDDPVEQEGVRRARQRASEADLVLWIYDAEEGSAQCESPILESAAKWMVRNKMDLLTSNGRDELRKKNEFELSNIVFHLSAATGLGVAEFLAQLAGYAKSYFGAESSLLTRERHRKALNLAQNALDRVLAEGPSGREDIVAEELRLAAQSLGRLTGQVDVEDILDVIFRDFCIGK